MEANNLYLGDNLEIMRGCLDNSVDLVLGSPPYEAARTYGIDFTLRGQDWVDWMLERMREMLRLCSGLVVMVVEGQTRKYRWSAAPALLMADLHRDGFCLRKPPIYKRVGICGSGGPDWLRNDYEFIVCATKNRGRLPWSNNTAMGKPPKYKPGGAMSSRLTDGTRVNEKKHGQYKPPEIANPGNIIECVVGGGHMGSDLAHKNEAPFPERLAEFFIRSFCPPGGIVLDPFAGSGTTLAVAKQTSRKWIGIDIRGNQIELCRERLAQTREGFGLL